MRWIGGRESSNVDDRRGLSTGGGVAIGGGLLGLIYLVIQLLSGGGGGSAPPMQVPGQQVQMSEEEQKAEDERAKFVKVVLAYTEDVWNNLFQQQGKQYEEPRLVLFRQ